ncbi:hypothetical protein GH5_02031 [Leishmania sp. Ghana 2012 LV757]|uniref:hypothetical protein n=1 Tax=Leishmania sp. Ghana 2012 LV757 TaxID=2803181 RepID=UPI001B467DAC|nr:hypothetical protein GH5_02031 [Leishmania sp. Ghana 2012 LV757]
MKFSPGDTTAQRPAVGVPPYRAPPLSGLYLMRYHPPTSGDALSDYLPREFCGEAAGGPTANLVEQSGACSAEARHAAVHTQLLGASSLSDGDIDLFALYSVCDVEPVPCLRCSLHMQATLNTCSYRLRQWYHLQRNDAESFKPGPVADLETYDEVHARSKAGTSPLIRTLQKGWYVFFFPISECGRLKDNLLVYVGDALIAGDVAECDLANEGLLRPLKTATLAAASKATSTNPRCWKSLFYYVISPVPVRCGARESTGVHFTVSWCNSPAGAPLQRWKKSLTLLYSYYCSPRAPDIFTCHAQFPSDTRLRLVRSPNCDAKVRLRSDVSEHAANVGVETIDGKPLEEHRHTSDYTFVLQFLFGDSQGILEETSTFAAAVVSTVFLLIMWLFITKDLIL